MIEAFQKYVLNSRINNFKELYSKNEKYYDYKGTINGSLFTDAEVEEIRNAQIQQFANFANEFDGMNFYND